MASGKPPVGLPQPAGSPSPPPQPLPLQPRELDRLIFDFERDMPPAKDVDAAARRVRDIDAAARLVEHLQASGFDPASRDALGNTLLMYAARSGNAGLASYLLQAFPALGPQTLNGYGQNAAMVAMASGHPEMLALLQGAGVQLQPDNPALQWYLQNRAGQTAALQLQDLRPLAALLAQDNFMNLRDASGRTLIFHAVMNADLQAIRFLCGFNSPPFLGWKDMYDNSVFRYTTRVVDVELGTAICRELRALRRKTRWMYKHPEEEWETDWREPRLRRRPGHLVDERLPYDDIHDDWPPGDS